MAMAFCSIFKLAFCNPTAARPEWTAIGARYHKDEENKRLYPRVYEDFVYSSRQKLFYSVTLDPEDFEAWDLRNTKSHYYPKVIRTTQYSADVNNYNQIDKDVGVSLKYLVVDDESCDIFWVRRHIISHLDYDHMDKTRAETLPYMTVGFDVHKFDREKCELVHMQDAEGSLGGLSFFIGNNQSFSVRASEFPGLKPNSIYFTDVNTCLIPSEWKSLPFVGHEHDIGIFNYDDQTFSPCYYPCDRQSIETITSAPMWFTPTN